MLCATRVIRGNCITASPWTASTRRVVRKTPVFAIKEGIVTRGVLIDIARMKGVDYLEPGTPIYPEDLARVGESKRA